MSHDAAQVRGAITLNFFYLGRFGKESCVVNRCAGCFANLAQDEKHILFASQGSKQRAFRQRLKLLRSYMETADEVAVISNLIENGAFFARCKIQAVR